MDANSPRWRRVTPSTFPWEDEAIDYLRSGIADADPNRGWSNFEFISGGVIGWRRNGRGPMWSMVGT